MIVLVLFGISTAAVIDPLGYTECVPYEDLDTLDKLVLDMHDEMRSWHHASNLCISPKLTEAAQQYAAQLVADTDADGKIELIHDPYNYSQGENICKSPVKMYTKWGSENVVAKCMYHWYSEESYFDYSMKNYNDILETGHFTAMLWKGSTHVGCAIGMEDDIAAKDAVFVCRYYSHPNIEGEFHTNIGDKDGSALDAKLYTDAIITDIQDKIKADKKLAKEQSLG